MIDPEHLPLTERTAHGRRAVVRHPRRSCRANKSLRRHRIPGVLGRLRAQYE